MEIKKYNECKTVIVLKAISGKWKPYIIYLLYHQDRRYIDIWREIPRISKKILSENLNELETFGLVSKETFNEAPPRVIYSLTDKGKSLATIFRLVEEWSEVHL